MQGLSVCGESIYLLWHWNPVPSNSEHFLLLIQRVSSTNFIWILALRKAERKWCIPWFLDFTSKDKLIILGIISSSLKEKHCKISPICANLNQFYSYSQRVGCWLPGPVGKTIMWCWLKCKNVWLYDMMRFRRSNIKHINSS